MMHKLFVDLCPPLKEIEFALISGKNELCATSYSTNLALANEINKKENI